MTIDQGIHFDVPSAVYFSDPAPQPSLTQSIAKVLIERSPLHAWHEHPRLGAKKHEDDEAEKYLPAQAIGNAAHKLMIGRGKEIEVADFDNWRTGLAKDFREQAEAIGKTVILRKHFTRARNMVEAARDIGGMGSPDDGNGEVVITWREGDLYFRSMIDWLRTDLCMVVDYKTTSMSCAPHTIGRLMTEADWPLQAAMQERGLNALDPDGAKRRKFRFVAQENTLPYALVVCELPESTLTIGRKRLDYAIKLWGACIRADTWPGYPPEILYPEYSAWDEAKWLEREVAESERPVNLMMAG